MWTKLYISPFILYYIFHQILKFTICLQAMLIPFTFFLSLLLSRKEKTMYCVTFSEKQEDYHVISWRIPQKELSRCDSFWDFLTNDKLTDKLYT